jgi:hypothetical protein
MRTVQYELMRGPGGIVDMHVYGKCSGGAAGKCTVDATYIWQGSSDAGQPGVGRFECNCPTEKEVISSE